VTASSYKAAVGLFTSAKPVFSHFLCVSRPMGQSEEIAGTAVYLASWALDFVTGATIRVDGGYSIR
jgi:NAD(P)-dependent dehydrogenase (short-subunit alcohol dehydrogenase family)